MKRWFYASSFKTRIWLSIALFSVFAVLFSGGTSYYIASVILEKKVRALNQNVVNKSAQAMEEKLRKVRIAALTFMSSKPFTDLIAMAERNAEITDYQHFQTNHLLQTPIFQMRLIEPAITSVLIDTPIGEFYNTDEARNPDVTLKSSAIYNEVKDESQFPIWIKSHTDPFFSSNQRVLSLLLQPTLQRNVHVLVNVQASKLSDYLIENKDQSTGEFFVYDQNNELAFDFHSKLHSIAVDPHFIDKLKWGKGNFEYRFHGVSYLVNYANITFPDHWMIVNVQSKNRLYKEFHLIQWMIFGTMLGFSLLALFISPKMTRLLLHPLTKLRLLMKQVEQNDLSVRYDSPFNDEVSQVGQRFNSMLDRIEDLLDEVMEVEKEKRVAEVKTLQAQIHPHFLYNTLNTIVWKSESEEHEQVREMIISLSLLFRLGLNNGEDLTTLGKELEHVQQYLHIQEKNYENLFEYEIKCGDDSLKCKPILKILLQPLVENCILHGFKDIDYKGRIFIQIGRDRDHIRMTVEDNGKGFDAAEVERTLQQFPHVQKGYALRNVNNRLNLFYGSKSSIHMESKPYEKTVIELRIPIEEAVS